MEPLDILSVALRAAAFIAALQAAGLAWFEAACARCPAAGASLDGLLRASVLCALAMVLMQRGLDAGRLAGEWSGVLDARLQALVWSRRPGLSSSVCAVGLLAVLAGSGRPTRCTALASLGALCVVASFALTGHTTEAAHAGLARGLVSLHVAIVAYWIGAVCGLHRLARQADSKVIARAALRFSRTAVWLVPLILPAGSVLVVSLLPDLAALRTVYGEFLLAKVLGFCVLIALAAANRLRYVPALAAGSGAAIRAFKHILVAEYVVLGAVLAATATMTSLFSWH